MFIAIERPLNNGQLLKGFLNIRHFPTTLYWLERDKDRVAYTYGRRMPPVQPEPLYGAMTVYLYYIYTINNTKQ